MKPSTSIIALTAATFYTVVQAQDIDPALFTTVPPGIDLKGCISDLHAADVNGDGCVKQGEYLGFIQRYGQRVCYTQDALTLQQVAAFNSLACICKSMQGSAPDCCLQSNACIPTAGATTPATRTEEQSQYLTASCIITDKTLDYPGCPPEIAERGTPPPVIITPVAMGPASGGLSDGNKWAILAAIIAALLLLLLCCCCCCVFRRRRAKRLEEEENETNEYAQKNTVPGDDEESPEQARRNLSIPPGSAGSVDKNSAGGASRNGPTVTDAEDDDEEDDDDSGYRRVRKGGNQTIEDPEVPRGRNFTINVPVQDDDSHDEGYGRKQRGGHLIDDEFDPDGRRIRGAGQLPPNPDPNDGIALRPIPQREKEEDPEWDQPGREFIDNRSRDEDEAQKFDRYNPDGGVYDPKRPDKDPVTWKNDWNRQKPEDPDDVDRRKHRIQSGLGEGEVWNKLEENEESERRGRDGAQPDVFDWVVQSALGVLDKNAEHLTDDEV